MLQPYRRAFEINESFVKMSIEGIFELGNFFFPFTHDFESILMEIDINSIQSAIINEITSLAQRTNFTHLDHFFPIKEEAESCLLFVAQYVAELLQFDNTFVVVVLSENLSGFIKSCFLTKTDNLLHKASGTE